MNKFLSKIKSIITPNLTSAEMKLEQMVLNLVDKVNNNPGQWTLWTGRGRDTLCCGDVSINFRMYYLKNLRSYSTVDINDMEVPESKAKWLLVKACNAFKRTIEHSELLDSLDNLQSDISKL